jgi:glycosyltransferase involved in cell wall biosynthesis
MPGELVSIVLPTYNRAGLIGETIQSVIDQSYPQWELIIIDDGSSDDTKERIALFEDERIQYHFFEHTGILGKVRNAGMRLAKGDYIAFLDSDDIWLPHKLEFQLSLLTKYPQASFVFGHGVQFGEGAIAPPELEDLFIGNIFLPQLLEEKFIVYPSTFFFQQEILNTVGYVNEQLSGGDNDFFFRMASRYEGVFIGEKLVKIRRHNQNISSERELIFSRENIELIHGFYKEKLLTRKQFKRIVSKQNYKLGLLHFERNQSKKAAHYFLKYALTKPMDYKGWARFFQASISRL